MALFGGVVVVWGSSSWADLPAWLRYGVALAFLFISTGLWFAGRFWPWGWVVGIVLLLMMADPSKAEKRGYHDF
jgi:hypothetical protein